MADTEDLADQARIQINRFEEAAREYSRLAHEEDELEARRHGVKEEAVARLMKGFQLNGNPHSMSSADKVVETDQGYADHLTAQRETTLAKELARSRMESRKLRALLAIARINATSAVGGLEA